MDQFSLFGVPEITQLLPIDGEAILYQDFFSGARTQDYFEKLKNELAWRQDEITLFGKTHPVPRLQAWYGEPHTQYGYSSILLAPLPFHPLLLEIKRAVTATSGGEFNCVLANLYRSGRDYAAWHSDDEKELGRNPVIASVSFGASRKFRFKHKYDKGQEQVEVDLSDGSLLLMRGKTQHFWKHQLVKTSRDVGERINLTFRFISR